MGNSLDSKSSQYIKDTSYIKSAGTLGIQVRCNYPKTTAVFSQEYKVSIRVPSTPTNTVTPSATSTTTSPSGTSVATTTQAVAIDYAKEVQTFFSSNAYTKTYHPIPTAEHITDWTREINQRGLAGAREYFPIAVKTYACSADPDRFYLANNIDVKQYFDAHPTENINNTGAKKHWDSSGKNENRVSCW